MSSLSGGRKLPALERDMPLWIGLTGLAVAFLVGLRNVSFVIKKHEVGRVWWVGLFVLSSASVIAIWTAQPLDVMIVLSGGSEE